MTQMKRRSTYQFGTLVPEPRKRGPNVWTYRYFEFEDGKKRRRKTIVGTLEQYPTRVAAERACEHLRLVANSEANNPECPSMGGLIDRYVDEILRPCIDVPVGGVQDSAARMSVHCAKSYRSILNRWVAPRWGTYQLHRFNKPETRAAIEEWFLSLWRSEKNPKGLAPKTVRSISNAMRLTFKFAVKWGYLNENPMAEKRVELPRGSTKRQKEPIQLMAGDFFGLLSRLPLLAKLAVAFAGWLGPRISEAFGLKWHDLDFIRGTVSFRRGFVQGRITPLKTSASRANLPIPDDVLELLRRWQECTAYRAGTDWVFASPYTKGQRPFWPGQLLKTQVKPIAVEAGLPNIGWHSFRHTVSAWAKEAGLELEDVKTLLRHEDIATTSNIYGDLGMEAKRRIQQKLVAFVREQAHTQELARCQSGWKNSPAPIQ